MGSTWLLVGFDLACVLLMFGVYLAFMWCLCLLLCGFDVGSMCVLLAFGFHLSFMIGLIWVLCLVLLGFYFGLTFGFDLGFNRVLLCFESCFISFRFWFLCGFDVGSSLAL